MNILEQSVCLGLKANSSLNSSPITYRRANRTISIPDAQKAQKPSRINTVEVFGVTMIPHDWIVHRGYFDAFGLPQEGDEITCDGVRYRVSESSGGEPCWRWHTGSGSNYLRIHTEIAK